MINFNPRTREGCDSWTTTSSIISTAHFNPRTREGCDGLADERDGGHPPISIHAPVKGATINLLVSLRLYSHFNPRTREGCDLLFLLMCDDINHISIHAPVKGATGVLTNFPTIAFVISIHAPVKGATQASRRMYACTHISIHAPVKGATPEWNSSSLRDSLFQSTHP